MSEQQRRCSRPALHLFRDARFRAGIVGRFDGRDALENPIGFGKGAQARFPGCVILELSVSISENWQLLFSSEFDR